MCRCRHGVPLLPSYSFQETRAFSVPEWGDAAGALHRPQAELSDHSLEGPVGPAADTQPRHNHTRVREKHKGREGGREVLSSVWLAGRLCFSLSLPV